MSEKITITEKQKNGAVEIIVDNKYYNDHSIYRNPIKSND